MSGRCLRIVATTSGSGGIREQSSSIRRKNVCSISAARRSPSTTDHASGCEHLELGAMLDGLQWLLLILLVQVEQFRGSDALPDSRRHADAMAAIQRRVGSIRPIRIRKRCWRL